MLNASIWMLSIQTSHQVGAGYEQVWWKILLLMIQKIHCTTSGIFRLGLVGKLPRHWHQLEKLHPTMGFEASGVQARKAVTGGEVYAAKEPRNRRSKHLPYLIIYQGHIISDTLQKTITYITNRKSGKASTPKKCLWMGGICDRSLQGTPFSLQSPRSWLKHL